MSKVSKDKLQRLVTYMASQISIPVMGSGGGYAPIGSIIAFMGITAPESYLACDGTVYDIADYSDLADFFESHFGSKNYFGGNGTTTFAVPDLSGEFLRGTGTNSHTNQGSGANVGVHQDATEHISMITGSGSGAINHSVKGAQTVNKDSSIGSGSTLYYPNNMTSGSSSLDNYYTSRPTNTSVLYCIKAIANEPGEYTAGDGIDITDGEISADIMPSTDMSEIVSPLPSVMSRRMKYSTDEQIVGEWIDGKPIYQKTVDCGALPNNDGKSVAHNITNIDKFISLNGIASQSDGYSVPLAGVSNTNAVTTNTDTNVALNANKTNIFIKTFYNMSSYVQSYVTLQYTKTTD